jgi:hypothetical protein
MASIISFQVGFNSSCRDKATRYFSFAHAKYAFFKIQFEPCIAEVGECSFEVLDVVFFVLGLYYDVIYVGGD